MTTTATRAAGPAIEEILESRTRIRVLDALVQATQPVTLASIAEQLEQPIGTVTHHVRLLANAGLVNGVRGDSYALAPDRWPELTDAIDRWAEQLARISDRLAQAQVSAA